MNELATKIALREIFSLQKCIQQMPNALTADDCADGLKHTFSPGACARELFMPTGMLVVGKVHRHAHLNIVSRGHCIVSTHDGIMEIDARHHPVTFVSTPNTKRAVYILEDTIWTCIHLTNETDIALIEKEIIIDESEFKELIDSIEEPDMTLIETYVAKLTHSEVI